MAEHTLIVAKIRQWIALNSDPDRRSGSATQPLSPEALRSMTKEYCDLVGPISIQLGQCAKWSAKGLFVETCSVCDDYPDLLALAKEMSFEGILPARGTARASAEIAKLLQSCAPAGVIVPVINSDDIGAVESAYGELNRTREMVAEVQALALARAEPSLRVAALRKLFRNNPGSSIWQEEIRRLASGAFEALQERITIAHQKSDFATARDLMKELERNDWGVSVSSGAKKACHAVLRELLSHGAGRRYGELGRAIGEARSTADPIKLADLEAAWVQVQNEFQCEPTPEADAAVADGFRWLAAHREREQRDQEFQVAVAAVEAAIDHGQAEQEVARCYAHMCSFQRAVPEHIRGRKDSFDGAIRARRRRKTLIRVVVVASAIILIGALISWIVRRGQGREEVATLVKEVETQLEAGQVAAAERLLAAHTDLAGEVEVIAVTVRVQTASVQWEEHRHDFKLWREGTEASIGGDISRADLAAMSAKLEALKPTLAVDEVAQCEQLLSNAKAVHDSTEAKQLETLAPRANAFRVDSTSTVSMNQIAESDRFHLPALAARRNRILTIIANGEGLLAEYSAVGEEHGASIKSGLDRLKEFQAETVSRMEDSEAFVKSLRELTDSYADLDEFNRRYAAILEDHRLVLAGLGLSEDFKKGKEMAQWARNQLRWNDFMDGQPERFFVWELSTPPAQGVWESLGNFHEANPDSRFSTQVQRLIVLTEKSFDANGESAASQMAEWISGSGMTEICGVSLTNGSPVYRRRSAQVDRASADPWGKGVMRDLRDMTVALDDLPAITKSQSKQYQLDTTADGGVGDCPTSTTLRDSLEPLVKDGTLSGARRRALQLITQIALGDTAAPSKREDSLLRLWFVMNLAELWMAELAFDKGTGVDLAVVEAMTQVRSKFVDVTSYDWVATRLGKGDRATRARLVTRASDALRLFASISVDDKVHGDAATFSAMKGVLTDFKIAGVVGVDPFRQVRSFQQAPGGDNPTDLLALVLAKEKKVDWVVAQVRTLEQVLSEHESPLAPMVVFSHRSTQSR
ncbi:MAG: hypothetical protein EXS15_08240 [Phycisphaerales bacterium]|nr:hypothetical protein [Phycisphaerales bacterium]